MSDPGPSRVRLPELPDRATSSSPLVSVIVPVTVEANVIRSSEGLLLASTNAARKLPGPSSSVLVT